MDFNKGTREEWALILGGSSGLGLASARKLATHGMHLCIIHRSRRSDLPAFQAEMEKMKKQGVKLKSFNIDALHKEKQESVADFFIQNKISIKLLLHSIAKGNLKPVYSENDTSVLSLTDFKLTIEAMALSLYSWVQMLLRHDLFDSPARILSFTSAGSRKALPHYAAVGAAKAALESITRSLAYELAPLQITANCIEAGVTDTASLQLIPNIDKIKTEALNRNPYKRLTTAEDVAQMVYLLTREESSWLNGAVIPVDGGSHIN